MNVRELITKLLNSFDLNEEVDVVVVDGDTHLVFEGDLDVDDSGTIYLSGVFRDDVEGLFNKSEYSKLFK